MGQGYRISAKAKEAEIYIYEDVGASFFGGVSAKQFAADLKKLGAVETIHVRLNSFGGDVFDGLAIYRQLVEHPARVVSHVDGLAASIASIIAMAGDEVLIAEAGFLMIHDASGIVIGTAEDMQSMAATLETVTSTLADVYVARTENKVDEVRAWMKEETWFTAADAVEMGFADSLSENMRIAAHLDPDRHRFKHAPAVLAQAEAVARPVRDAAALRLNALRAQLALRKSKELRAA